MSKCIKSILISAVLLIFCILPGAAAAAGESSESKPAAEVVLDSSAGQVAPLMKKVFTPKYSPISLIVAELGWAKSERGKIVAIGNDIYVEDEPQAIATMTQLFMRADRVARQIMFEARIIEATPDFVEKLNIKWGAKYVETGQPPQPDGAAQESLTMVAKMTDYSDEAKLEVGFFLDKVDSLLLNATIGTSEAKNEAHTIVTSRLMAANDQEIFIDPSPPMHGCHGCYSRTTTTNVRFREHTRKLKIKPHIEENSEIVTIDLELEEDGYSTFQDPATKPREAKVRVMVKDGATVVVGRAIADGQPSDSGQTHGLNGLSLREWLYPDQLAADEKSEILIFITPTIITIDI